MKVHRWVKPGKPKVPKAKKCAFNLFHEGPLAGWPIKACAYAPSSTLRFSLRGKTGRYINGKWSEE